MHEPKWLFEARKYLGVAEIPGPQTSGVIAGWLQRLHAWWSDDATPWCGVFVAAMIEECGLPLPKYWMRAKAWADWGSKLSAPVTGCIVVFERQGGGHVGFVVGRTIKGNLLVLGGNQRDCVCVSEFDRNRVLAYVWPPGEPQPMHRALLVMDSTGGLSINEA